MRGCCCVLVAGRRRDCACVSVFIAAKDATIDNVTPITRNVISLITRQ